MYWCKNYLLFCIRTSCSPVHAWTARHDLTSSSDPLKSVLPSPFPTPLPLNLPGHFSTPLSSHYSASSIPISYYSYQSILYFPSLLVSPTLPQLPVSCSSHFLLFLPVLLQLRLYSSPACPLIPLLLLLTSAPSLYPSYVHSPHYPPARQLLKLSSLSSPKRLTQPPLPIPLPLPFLERFKASKRKNVTPGCVKRKFNS